MRFFILTVMCVLFAFPLQAEETMYMRVVARSDAPAAQLEKQAVRTVALLLGPEHAGLLETWHPQCRVERKTWQPDEKTPPAETVYITIGPGMGRNWWGVLYPESAAWAASEGTGLLFPFFNWLRELFIPR
ncbi:MAG: hypothetical protein IJO67_10710 [Clostridia bacterium]|nr:hypothetical protein [Clostridia bacterium]MBR2053506.1 hypothetical protein [Clostridia bacterium]